jgi:hypothetical protein
LQLRDIDRGKPREPIGRARSVLNPQIQQFLNTVHVKRSNPSTFVNMSADEQVVPAGRKPYSATNKVPNVQEFMARLDKDKAERDAAIDADLKKNKLGGDVKAHTNESKPSRKDTRTVRDPVTGKDVDIRDVKLDFEEAVENPQVCIPWLHDYLYGYGVQQH